MADFDLIQTDAQVQSILNDGQNMQGAGAQTTLTTESVLLKDVNGNYHKILKSSFTEAIRDTLADLLVNNDKGTTINQIAAIANGDFGSITPANLASVLGVYSPTFRSASNMEFTVTNNNKIVGNLGTGNSNADCLMLIGCSDMSAEGFGLYMFRWQKENSIIGQFTECVGGRLNYVSVTPHYFNQLQIDGLKPDLTYYVNIVSMN